MPQLGTVNAFWSHQGTFGSQEGSHEARVSEGTPHVHRETGLCCLLLLIPHFTPKLIHWDSSVK